MTAPDITAWPKRRAWLAIAPLVATLLVFLCVVLPWILHTDLQDNVVRILGPISAFIWVVVLGWSSYHLAFQLASLFCSNRLSARIDRSGQCRFSILYATRDDFQKDSCLSCIQQDYPNHCFKVIICDDGNNEAIAREIDEFAKAHSVIVVRRDNKPNGFKAGNLNFAVDHKVDEPWFIIVDADQILPKSYLAAMAAEVCGQPDSVAFVQGSHISDHLPLKDLLGKEIATTRRATPFQKMMGLEIQMFYDRDLMLRETHGFLPFLGHGAAIRRSAWQEVGGFPHVVSEDFAFSMKLSEKGRFGVFAEQVRSWESYPKDFGSFLIRLSKFSAGTAELLKLYLGGFLIGNAPWVAKLDFLMTLGWYCIMPLIVINVYLSAFVCHRLWSQSVSALHPLLPYLFVGMFLLTITVVLSAPTSPIRAILYWFWASTVYCASLPISMVYFLYGFHKAEFRRTPKGGGYVSPPFRLSIVMALTGGVTVWLASYQWRSPFSPVLLAYGCSYFAFIIPQLLDRDGMPWKLLRWFVVVPGSSLIAALWLMWSWGKL